MTFYLIFAAAATEGKGENKKGDGEEAGWRVDERTIKRGEDRGGERLHRLIN